MKELLEKIEELENKQYMGNAEVNAVLKEILNLCDKTLESPLDERDMDIVENIKVNAEKALPVTKTMLFGNTKEVEPPNKSFYMQNIFYSSEELRTKNNEIVHLPQGIDKVTEELDKVTEEFRSTFNR